MRFPLTSGPVRAFTILEVVVAMVIAMLIIGVAVMSLKGVDRESKIRQSAARLEWTARTAMREALLRRRPQCVRLATNGFAGETVSGRTNWKRLPKGGALEIKRWGEARWRKPKGGESWWFRPGMPCEPISVRLSLPEGRLEMSFDPLTAIAMDERLAVKP